MLRSQIMINDFGLVLYESENVLSLFTNNIHTDGVSITGFDLAGIFLLPGSLTNPFLFLTPFTRLGETPFPVMDATCFAVAFRDASKSSLQR